MVSDLANNDRVILPMNNHHNGKMIIQVVVIALVLLVVPLSGCIIEENRGPRFNIISFSISISSDGPTELVLPLPVFQPLFENISVLEGECEYRVVETPYGDGLWVRLDAFTDIGGKWNEGTDDRTTQMSINMTTMVPLEDEEPPPDAPKYWIPDRDFWLNWSSGPLSGMSISSYMVVHRWTYKYSVDLDPEDLETGWNKVFVGAQSYTVSAP
jgi:hypothetical protein